MPRGGTRIGAGRPVGSKDSSQRIRRPGVTAQSSVPEPHRDCSSPLAYMLSVLADPDVDPARRDRMAFGAAPYVHAKVVAPEIGKKQAAEEAAKTIHVGTSWEKLLDRNKPVCRGSPNV